MALGRCLRAAVHQHPFRVGHQMNEYGRRGLAGVMNDHALATVVTVMLAWVVAVCAIVTSFGGLF